MELEFFKKLPLDEYFHDLERGYEFKKVAQSDTYCTCQCTRKIPFDETTVKVGEILSIDFDAVAIEDLALGKYPDNSKHLYIKTEQPQPEQHSSELKTMLIADALKLGLKKGDRVWVELEVEAFDNGDCTTAFKHPKRQSVIWLKTSSTQIIYTPQPFVPKHREKCNVLLKSNTIFECIALVIDEQTHALIERTDNDILMKPEDIVEFLPFQ